MNEIIEFFQGLFSSEFWPARWNCGIWSPFHGWLYILSDVMIWAAYFIIPVYLVRLILKKKLPFLPVMLLFTAFIVFCGITHLLDAIIFWWPAYRLSAIVRFATALVSWATVVALIRVMPSVLSLKSPDELAKEISARQEAELILEKKNQELEESNKELDTFVYSVSHDLRGPVATAIGLSNFILEAETPEEQRKLNTLLRESLLQLDEFIMDVIQYSQNNRMTEHLSFINLNVLIQDCWSSMTPLIQKRDIHLNVDSTVSGQILFDDARLAIVFKSLMSNAIRFAKKDVSGKVDIKVRQTNDDLLIEFEDNGVGIPEDIQVKVFDMFYRGNAESRGSGLGLYIVQRVIKKLNGNIALTSKVGEFTRFNISLPLIENDKNS